MHSQNFDSPTASSPRAELQPSPAAKDNTVDKGMLYCAPSCWRKSHFYLSKTTFPFYHQQKKERPHLSALHNPATASKAMFTWEKDTGQTLRACLPALGNQENNNSGGYQPDPGISSSEKQPLGKTTHVRKSIRHERWGDRQDEPVGLLQRW